MRGNAAGLVLSAALVAGCSGSAADTLSGSVFPSASFILDARS